MSLCAHMLVSHIILFHSGTRRSAADIADDDAAASIAFGNRSPPRRSALSVGLEEASFVGGLPPRSCLDTILSAASAGAAQQQQQQRRLT